MRTRKGSSGELRFASNCESVSIKLQRPKEGQSKICRGFRTTGVKEVMKIPPASGKKKMPVAAFQSPTKLALQAALARLA